MRFSRSDVMSVIEPKLRVGQVVAVKGGTTYAVVRGVFPVPNRWGSPYEYRAWVDYVDPETGRTFSCHKFTKCTGSRMCPIHSESLNASIPPADCVFPDYDLAFYAVCGMLHPDIAARACSAGKLPFLSAEDYETALALKAEWATRLQPKE